MNKNEMINQLAMEVITGERTFTELYNMVEPQFNQIVDSYLIRNNLTGFTFDKADYISATGQALWECLTGYDSSKGDFMPRLTTFARKRMKEITDYNLASKRFDKSKQVVSYEQLFESEELDLEDENSEINDTQKIINDFIKTDKYGQVVRILASTKDQKLRNKSFTEYFGQYTATERKKVQRVRERLLAHLTQNGVFI
ncbi:hypothetical protein LAV60_15640 [Clostridium sporogenes]|uniref:hypothetical protein n=1 Tax=Clostridium sporogenes TaxID=1509 RepID=UPI002237BFAF|nr:hypothetical protein [Clostridium sporogenes]MCW6094604.1 hypothetical protein [Clostridium sporogenes]